MGSAPKAARVERLRQRFIRGAALPGLLLHHARPGGCLPRGKGPGKSQEFQKPFRNPPGTLHEVLQGRVDVRKVESWMPVRQQERGLC